MTSSDWPTSSPSNTSSPPGTRWADPSPCSPAGAIHPGSPAWSCARRPPGSSPTTHRRHRSPARSAPLCESRRRRFAATSPSRPCGTWVANRRCHQPCSTNCAVRSGGDRRSGAGRAPLRRPTMDRPTRLSGRQRRDRTRPAGARRAANSSSPRRPGPPCTTSPVTTTSPTPPSAIPTQPRRRLRLRRPPTPDHSDVLG